MVTVNRNGQKNGFIQVAASQMQCSKIQLECPNNTLKPQMQKKKKVFAFIIYGLC